MADSRPGVRASDAAPVQVSAFLADVARRVGGTVDLAQLLDQVVEAVVELLGFGVAALNLVTPEGDLQVVTVCGPDEVRDELLGSRMGRAEWDGFLAQAEPVGRLRFADSAVVSPDQLAVWIPPQGAVPDDDQAWQPDDALFAPLHSADGTLQGVLSVDLPPGGRRPDAHLCQLLELFAVQASLALDQARVLDELHRSQQVFQRAFEHSPIGMAVFDAERQILRVNPAYCRLLGRTEQELLGHSVHDFSHPDDVSVVDRASAAVRRSGGVEGMERRYLRPDGTTVWGRVSLIVLDGDARGAQVLAHVEDITASRAARAELEHRASSDGLTGLANRSALERVLAERLREPRRRIAVLFCDLDHFKAVNDTHGHAAGDALLQQVASAVESVLRPGDVAGRLGGDEFVVLLDRAERAEAVRVAQRLRQAVREVARSTGSAIPTSMTIGVALSASGSAGPALLAEADRALYRAKALGRDRVVVSDGDVEDHRRPAC